MLIEYNIPFHLGHAVSNEFLFGTKYDYEKGWAYIENLFPYSNGVLASRYSYIPEGDAVGSGAIRGIFVNGFLIAVTSDGTLKYRDYQSNTWQDISWTGTYPKPVLPNKPIIFAPYRQYETIFSPMDNSMYIMRIYKESGVLKFNYCMPHNNTKGIPFVEDNRVIVLKDFGISYSNTGDPTSGYDDNYANVGPDNERCIYAFHLNGSTFVVKNNSIWGKQTSYEAEIRSNQFFEVVSNIQVRYNATSGEGNHPVCIAPSMGAAFIDTAAGIMEFRGAGLWRYITDDLPSQPSIFQDWYNVRSFPCFLHVWRREKILLASFPDADVVFAYHIPTRRWSRWTGLKIRRGVNADINERFYIVLGNNQIYRMERIGVGVGESPESGIFQRLRTPFLDLDMPFYDKKLLDVYVYGKNIEGVRVYYRRDPYGSGDELCRWDTPSDYVLHCPSSSPLFKEISIEIIGTDNLIVKRLGVRVDVRKR